MSTTFRSKDVSAPCATALSGIRALVFDVDGLMADTEYYHGMTTIKMMEEYGVKLHRSYIDQFVGISTKETFLRIKKDFGVSAGLQYLVNRKRELYAKIIKEKGLKAYPGLKEIIERARMKRLKLAVGSSSMNWLVDLMLDCILESLGICDGRDTIFDAIVSGSDVKRLKPAPDIYRRVARMLLVSPSECLVLEDSAAGVAAAKKAGMMCIAVKGRYTNKQDLNQADFIVGNLRQVLNLLGDVRRTCTHNKG
jgi:beta-phosphoglucomutase